MKHLHLRNYLNYIYYIYTLKDFTVMNHTLNNSNSHITIFPYKKEKELVCQKLFTFFIFNARNKITVYFQNEM